MSRKAHPVGFRLGLSQPWQHIYAPYIGATAIVNRFTLQMWLRNFAQQNGFYFLQTYHMTVERVFEYLTIIGLFPYAFDHESYRPTKFYTLYGDLYKIRKRLRQEPYNAPQKQRVLIFHGLTAVIKQMVKMPKDTMSTKKKVRRLWDFLVFPRITKRFYQKRLPRHAGVFWSSFYKFWSANLTRPRRGSKNKHFKQFLLVHNVSPLWLVNYLGQGLQKIKNQSKKKTRAKALNFKFRKKTKHALRRKRPAFRVNWRQELTFEYLKFLHYRLSIVRLKFFFENLLQKRFGSRFVVHLNNFNDVFYAGAFQTNYRDLALVPRIINTLLAVSVKTSEYAKYEFLGTFMNLTVSSALLRTPHVLLQWLWMYGHKIRKHSLYITQPQLLRIFLRSLESSILLVGILQGARFEIVGKLNDSTRTRKQLTFYGKTFQRQKLMTTFAYATKHLPSYIGVFGIRLWLIY